jgi:hypothetical protein
MNSTKFATMMVFLAAAALAVNGCTAFGPAPIDTPAMCTGTEDDHVACTVDVCPASGVYDHITRDADCAAGQMCSATAGCIARDPVCPASCDDRIACTVDSCASGACRHVANADACPGAVCRASAADGASGCYAPPVVGCSSASDCEDHVACTVDACVAGVCRHIADVTECAAGETCDATDGCVGGTPVPTPTRFCADGALIGEQVRMRFTEMSGIRTFAGGTFSGDMGVMLYSSVGAPHPTFGRVVEESITAGGTLNVHPFEGNSLTFDSRMANLQAVSTSSDDVTCEARGIALQVYRSGSWVDLPEGFCYFGWDTQPGVTWGASPDPLIPTDARIGRILLNQSCETQFQVYEGTTYRPAR